MTLKWHNCRDVCPRKFLFLLAMLRVFNPSPIFSPKGKLVGVRLPIELKHLGLRWTSVKAPLAHWLQDYLSLKAPSLVSFSCSEHPRRKNKAKDPVAAGEGWNGDHIPSCTFSRLLWLSGIFPVHLWEKRGLKVGYLHTRIFHSSTHLIDRHCFSWTIFALCSGLFIGGIPRADSILIPASEFIAAF